MATIGIWVGYLGMAVAIISGAQWPDPRWGMTAVGLAILGIGVVIKRKAGAPPIHGGEGAGEGARAARSGTIADGIAACAAGVKALADRAPKVHLEEVKKGVEELVHIGPARLGEAQEAVSARVGFAAYAEVMGPLATAERLLWRAWSAASDGHRPESVSSLREAIPYAEQAASLATKVIATVKD